MSSPRCSGVGVGLRIPHLRHILSNRPDIPWLEVHSCNYLSPSPVRELLLRTAELYPISLHGVSLNLGGTDPLDESYLKALKQLMQETQAALVSDHICFTALNGRHYHDLLPIPFTQQAVNNLSERIQRVQDYLGREILIENATQYYQYAHNELTEAEFINQVCQSSGCQLLLDLSNAYINQQNHAIPIDTLLNHLAKGIVGEIHLGGYAQGELGLVDSHDHPISEPVWRLFEQVLPQFQDVPVLIEWDSQLPQFEILQQQQQRAHQILETNTHGEER